MMKKPQIKDGVILTVIFLLITATVVPSIVGVEDKNNNLTYDKSNSILEKDLSGDGETEYWAIIFAVGIYYKHPEQNIPSMIECAENLYGVLVDSPNWKEDHIHKVTGSDATGLRLIRELLWLRRNDDGDDMSLIYLASHGGPWVGKGGKLVDLPPKDEDDGADEVLAMYHGFDRWYARIWDDLLNFFLGLLDSKGVCLIVDSCYAGGFNDEPLLAGIIVEDYTAELFAKGFAEDLAAPGRVVLMSCREDEVEYGSVFSEFLINGFSGQADIFGNMDGINSAEEAFEYVLSEIWDEQHPTILDLYQGEFPVTYSQ